MQTQATFTRYPKYATQKSRQEIANSRTFDPTNKSADCWSAAHSYDFDIRVKSMQHKKSFL